MATQPEVPLTEAGQAALRDAVLSYLEIMPFEPGALISRSLWLSGPPPRAHQVADERSRAQALIGAVVQSD